MCLDFCGMFWKVYLTVMSSHWMHTPGLIYESKGTPQCHVYIPPRNKGLIAGLIKGTQCCDIPTTTVTSWDLSC